MAEQQLKCKCVLVGNNGVGKTSLITAYVEKRFPEAQWPRTVYDNTSVMVECEGKQISLGLWDTYEQEEYDRLRPLSYPQTDVFLLCFNIKNGRYGSSFERIQELWHSEITHHCPGTPYLLIGLQQDLRPLFPSSQTNVFFRGYFKKCIENDNHIPMDIFKIIESFLQNGYDDKNNGGFVSDAEAREYCDKIGGYKYMTCSSLEMKGVNEIFDEVCKCYLRSINPKSAKRKGCNLL